MRDEEKEKGKKSEDREKEKKRKPYQKPALTMEELFEATVLACTKLMSTCTTMRS